LTKTSKTLAVMQNGCALCCFSVVGLPKLASKHADNREATAFVPKACITARKTVKTG